MDSAVVSLQSVLVLLASSVLAVVVCMKPAAAADDRLSGDRPRPGAARAGAGVRHRGNPPARRVRRGVPDVSRSGSNSAWPKLLAMRRAVFGLGLAQVAATIALALGAALAAGASWQAGAYPRRHCRDVLDRDRLQAARRAARARHGARPPGYRHAAVPGPRGGSLAGAASGAGPVRRRARRGGSPSPWARRCSRSRCRDHPRTEADARLAGIVARRRSNELFVLNVLLVTLLLAFVTGLAGLSLVLGAFLAGMLISRDEYRFQVEEDIKPFRDVSARGCSS